MNLKWLALVHAALLAGALPVLAGDPKVTTGAINAHLIPIPKTVLPEMPADGSGIYRLSLDGALGASPLVVVLEIRDGRATTAVALPVHNANAWCPSDASKLTYQGGHLAGTIAIECIPPFSISGAHCRRLNGKPNPNYKSPFELKSTVTATISIDAKCDGSLGVGGYTAKWTGKEMPFGYQMRPNAKGTLSLLREPSRPMPAKVECDLFLPTALGDSTLADGQGKSEPSIWLRLAMDKGVAIRALGYVSLKPPAPGSELTWKETKASMKDGRLTGRLTATVTGRPDDAITLELDGRSIGRHLFGTVAFQHGDTKITTQWLGLLYDASAWRLPMELPVGKWDWQHDRPVEEELTAQALEESLKPVLPGEPGKTGFWTWRSLVRNNHVSSIYPPSFDIQETKDAAKYRFVVNGSKNAAGKKFEFTADKPWLPLTPIWKEMPPGTYQLTVTPLDGEEKIMPGPMRLGILDKATAKASVVEARTIAIIKRPTFSGPYTTSSQAWNETALAGSRWHRESLGSPERRGLALSTSGNHWTGGGDHGFGMCIAADLWATLANRALTDDPSERLLAEEMLAFYAESLEIHQRTQKPSGYIYDYQSNTPMAHWPGEAILDAFLQTGDPRWKVMAIKLGQALVLMQKPNGAFMCNRGFPDKMVGPHGFFSWREGNKEYAAVELLYFFGRLRRDLRTDAFVDAETKAYDWTMKVAVRERFWPLNLSHSMSQGYPIWNHSVTGLYFSRYILECAPSERRDLKLAEEVARWAEDHGMNWQRASDGKQTGPITPRVERIDRYNNEPVATNLLAAIVFQELAQATGNKLWAAKGDALATAVLQSRNPKNGRMATHLQPSGEDYLTRQFHDASFRHGSFCNDWAVQLLREYAALRNSGVKK